MTQHQDITQHEQVVRDFISRQKVPVRISTIATETGVPWAFVYSLVVKFLKDEVIIGNIYHGYSIKTAEEEASDD